MIERRARRRAAGLGVVAAGALLATSACSGSVARARGSGQVLRLGVSPTLPQAPAEIGLATGGLRRSLSPTGVAVTSFASGRDAAVAMTAGAIDAAYMGPGPTAAIYAQGTPVAIVSGAASGGASLVVRRDAGIAGPADLHDARIAAPGVGSTQDVALRHWLQEHDLRPREDGGDVSIAEAENAKLLPLLRGGQIDAAWAPEPYPSYLVAKGVADVLVDEASLWPSGAFVTSSLVVSRIYMEAHPDVVRRLVEANVDAIGVIQAHPTQAKDVTQRALAAAGGPALSDPVMDEAWRKVTFSWDPLPASMAQVAANAYAAGVIEGPPGDLSGLYRLGDLDAILRERGLPPVSDVEMAA
jgi:NitT/TauT family transport system substrate-binding protein